MEILSERQRDIIERYLGENGKEHHTLQEIGDKYNITRERIRCILLQALRKLLRLIEKHGNVL